MLPTRKLQAATGYLDDVDYGRFMQDTEYNVMDILLFIFWCT